MKHVWTLDESPARAGRRPGALAEYKALRDSCVWRPAVLSHKLLILRNDGQTEVEGTRITECVVDAPGADGSAVFLIRRLGVPATGAPLSVEPGMWARWELSKLTFPPELVDASGAARATSYFMWSVLPNNASEVPFPPLHNHHAAFKPKATQSHHPSWLKGFKPAFHAAAPGSAPDSWCEARGGGADCILKQLPRGYSFHLDPGAYSMIINDVREDAAAPPYEVHYEMALRLLRPRAAAAPAATAWPETTAVRHTDWFMQGTFSELRFSPLINGTMYDTFEMPGLGKEPAVHLYATRMPRNGTIVSEWWHGHHSLTDEAWVVAGAAARDALAQVLALYLRSPAPHRELSRTPIGLGRSGAAALPKLKAAALTAIRRSGAQLLCRYIPKTERVNGAAQAIAVGSPPGLYDRAPVSEFDARRHTSCAALGHRFHEGSTLSTVCWSRATTTAVGTGFDSRRPLTPVADDAPLIAPDGTDLVPHQHCNWGASIAFDGDI